MAVSLALGGDCLADIALVRAEPGVFGRVASDPTVSRLIDAVAGDADAALAAIESARAAARARVWALAGDHAPDYDTDGSSPLIIDLDATLVTSHSDKEQARPTFKRGYGFHPLCAFLDHGAGALGSRCSCCCGLATPDRTPPPTTSSSPRRRWRSCPATAQEPGRAGEC